MSEEQQQAAWERLRAMPGNTLSAERDELRAELAMLEEHYGAKSTDLHRLVASGRIPEDENVCRWFILIDEVDYLESHGR